jgi:hypothetical protein
MNSWTRNVQVLVSLGITLHISRAFYPLVLTFSDLSQTIKVDILKKTRKRLHYHEMQKEHKCVSDMLTDLLKMANGQSGYGISAECISCDTFCLAQCPYVLVYEFGTV